MILDLRIYPLGGFWEFLQAASLDLLVLSSAFCLGATTIIKVALSINISFHIAGLANYHYGFAPFFAENYNDVVALNLAVILTTFTVKGLSRIYAEREKKNDGLILTNEGILNGRLGH